MPNKALDSAVSALISLVKQLQKENVSLKQQLATALNAPADKQAAEEATKRAEAAETLAKSLQGELDAERQEDEELVTRLQPFLSTESDNAPTVLEVTPPEKTEAANK